MGLKMQVKSFFFILILFSSSSLFGMSKLPKYHLRERSLSTLSKYISSTFALEGRTSSLYNHHSLKNRTFSSSPSQFWFADSFKKFYEAYQDKISYYKSNYYHSMLGAIEEKIKNGKSTLFSYLTLEELLADMQKTGFINYESKYTSLNALCFAIKITQNLPEKDQEKIIELFIKYGAHIDGYALLLSVRTLNVGALAMLQPHFEPMHLYTFYVEAKTHIDQMMQNYQNLDKKSKARLELYQKIFLILKRPCKEATYTRNSSMPLDRFKTAEFKETFTTSSCEEFYNALHGKKEYSNSSKSYSYNYNNDQTNRKSNNTTYNATNKDQYNGKLIDSSKYQNPIEQELCELYNKIIKQTSREEFLEISRFAQKNDIKQACMQKVLKFHPDRFHYDATLQKIATTVTQRINHIKNNC